MAKINLPKESVGEQITATVTIDDYSRYLTNKLVGDELAKVVAREEQRRRQAGQDVTYVERKERFECTFRDVKVQKKGDQPTEAEKALKSKVFPTREGVKSITVTKTNCPRFYVKTAEGKLHQVYLEGKSLAGGQTATAVWKVYQPKVGTPAIGFEGLIFDEEPKLWTPGPQAFGGYEVEASEAPAPAPAEEAAPVSAPAEAATTAQNDFEWDD